MCVLAFAWRAHPRWPLIVAGNRDELHARSAAPLARWDDPDHLIAGKDLQSGGTWLGISEQSRFAVVTNLRGYGPSVAGRKSRGALITGFLSGTESFHDPAQADLTNFNPFNLIFADHEHAWFLSNRPEPVRSKLAHGIYGLSNGALDEPWPKTLRLKEYLIDWVTIGDDRPEALLDSLADQKMPDIGIASALPSDVPQEPSLSPIFIRNPIYGTRCSTVVAVDNQGKGIVVERRYDQAGQPEGETLLPVSWAR